jgi:microcystin-dependent protein
MASSAVRLLAGYFGSPDPWAMNDFEAMQLNENGAIAAIYGDTYNGAVRFENGYFGPES